MRVAGFTLLALVLGFFGGWAVTTSAAIRYMEAFDIFDRDGGGAMGAFFIIGPFVGLIVAIVAAGIVLVRGLRKDLKAPVGAASPAGGGGSLLVAAVAVVSVYLVAWFVIQLGGPYGLEGAAKPLAEDGIPALFGLAAGIGAWTIGRRRNA
jgi:hypothetical protein